MVKQQSSSSRLERMQACVHSLLVSIQEDPSRQGLLDTPKRVAKAMLDMTEGYRADPAQLLNKALFDEPDIQEGAGGLVLVRDIDFASLSQDTLLPFYGRCHIAYVPSNGIVLGLSKLARLTKLCAKQLHTRDSLARQLLHYLHKQLRPEGAVVVIQAYHLDYTAGQPPQLQSYAAASGCFAAAKGVGHHPDSMPEAAAAAGPNSSTPSSDIQSSIGATLEEVLELMGAPVEPLDVQLLQDAANPLCLLQPSCNCSSSSSSSSRFAATMAATVSTPVSSSSLQLRTAPACAACGSARLAPHVLRGMSASAGGLDSPRAPVTPDPSENSDSDGSEQGSDLYCASLLASSGDLTSAALNGPSCQPIRTVIAAESAATGMSATPAMRQQQQRQQQQQQQLCGTVSMEAALLQLLAEAGIDAAASVVQTAARRHVLSLLAATAGYHQEQPSRPILPPSCSCHNGQQQQQQQQTSPQSQLLSADMHSHGHQQQYRQFEHHVPFMSQCEHHMLPFHGTLHIQYLMPEASSSSCGCCLQPRQQQQPLSAEEAAQLVQCFTKRLQVQERITQQVAAAVQQLLQPAGVMVVVQAVHMCMVARGVENHAGSTSTRAALGVFESDPQLRCCFLKRVREQQAQGQQCDQQVLHQQGCHCSC